MIDFTTASDEQRGQIYAAIAREIGDDRFFTTKELDVLPRILAPFEQVLSFSSGLMDGNTWLIVLTDQRVLFVDKGMIFGLRQASIELQDIVAIEGETGLFFGSIVISCAGGPRQIRNVWKRTVNPFVNKVRATRAARQRGECLLAPGTSNETPPPPAAPAFPSPTPAPRVQPPADVQDLTAQLERLARLRNAGSISEAEFQAFKAKLLT